MARFFGKVGYELEGTLVDDVWTASVVERDHQGDVLEQIRSIEPADKVNDDYRLQHRISIIGDEFMLEHVAKIKYVNWMGVAWTVISIRLDRPRLILSLGGVYDGKTASG